MSRSLKKSENLLSCYWWSELFGSLQQFKNEILTEIAATLAFATLQNNDKTGLILFSDQIELYIPPKKGKSHILRIIRELIEFQPKNKHTDIAKAFEFLNKITKKKNILSRRNAVK